MPPADRSALVRTVCPGRRFFLPPGYSLASRPGKRHVFTVAMYASQEFADPIDATSAAWAHAGLPVPVRLWEHVR